jgi:hypothetical protein
MLLLHLLKWQYQPARQGNSWRVSIENNRDALARHMTDNPSLKVKVPEAMTDAYRRARRDASVETGLLVDTFPAECPWSFEAVMQDHFWP